MKTLARLAPLAVLLATVFAAPASFADTSHNVRLAFRYDRSAPAEVTFAALRTKAAKACSVSTGRTLISRAERACAKDLINQVVDKIGDARLAQLSGHPLSQASIGSMNSGS